MFRMLFLLVVFGLVGQVEGMLGRFANRACNISKKVRLVPGLPMCLRVSTRSANPLFGDKRSLIVAAGAAGMFGAGMFGAGHYHGAADLDDAVKAAIKDGEDKCKFAVKAAIGERSFNTIMNDLLPECEGGVDAFSNMPVQDVCDPNKWPEKVYRMAFVHRMYHIRLHNILADDPDKVQVPTFEQFRWLLGEMEPEKTRKMLMLLLREELGRRVLDNAELLKPEKFNERFEQLNTEVLESYFETKKLCVDVKICVGPLFLLAGILAAVLGRTS